MKFWYLHYTDCQASSITEGEQLGQQPWALSFGRRREGSTKLVMTTVEADNAAAISTTAANTSLSHGCPATPLLIRLDDLMVSPTLESVKRITCFFSLIVPKL